MWRRRVTGGMPRDREWPVTGFLFFFSDLELKTRQTFSTSLQLQQELALTGASDDLELPLPHHTPEHRRG